MAWALLAAFVSQIVRLFVRNDELESIIGRSHAPYIDAENYPGPITIAGHKHES
jgi:hypothetical protein